jgi:hypothetical protein
VEKRGVVVIRLISMAWITHPVCATLDHPLFAFGGKREGNERIV